MHLLHPVAAAPPPPLQLDSEQAEAVAARERLIRVLGAPGSGKTVVALESIAARVESGRTTADRCVLLTPGRQQAERLRTRLTSRLAGTSTVPLARSVQSLGFGVLTVAAAVRGEPRPRLLSGPEQDVILAELLGGHLSDGRGPQWPARFELALATRGFRQELRDLLMRAVELGLEAGELAELGRRHARPEWVAAADVLREYDEVTALAAPGAHDPAWLLGAAASAIGDDDEVARQVAGRLDVVVVDDAQELTPAGLRLLTSLREANPALALVLVGDPDAATQTFRGADPRILASQWRVLGAGRTVILRTDHRCVPPVRAAADAVAARIGVLGDHAHRAPEPRPARDADLPPAPGGVEVHQVRTLAQEGEFVAGHLRRAHLLEAVGWSQMVVIVRGRARTATMRRALATAGVPVASDAGEAPVRDEPAVRPLLALLALVVGTRTSNNSSAEVADVLTSPIGAVDTVTLRRLRRALRRAELAGGGGRTSDELLASCLVTPALLVDLGQEAAGARRVAAMITAGRRSISGGGRADEVIWAMWEAAGLAERWRERALAGGPAGARADRDLDAVIALFEMAGRFVDRLPRARIEAFLEHVVGQEIPEDTLAARPAHGPAVEVLTPQAAAGREWDLVVVAGVQEGAWPDLRVHGSLLGSSDLVEIVTTGQGPARQDEHDRARRRQRARAAVAAVRHDETRLFHVALTRARTQLVVTAVHGEDQQPSPYLDILDPLPGQVVRSYTPVDPPLTLRSVVGLARRELLCGDEGARGAAVTTLAALARERVPGADPGQWWALTARSDTRARRGNDRPVEVSPSAIDSFSACPLRWLLVQAGGEGPGMEAASIGTLVHEIAAENERAEQRRLHDVLDEKWPLLGLRPGWVNDAERAKVELMLTRLAGWFAQSAAAGWRRLAVEQSMRATLGRASLRATLDRVEIDAHGAVRVIDYKTGTSKPAQAEIARHPQLGAYQLVLGQPGDLERPPGIPSAAPVAGAALVHLGAAAGSTPTSTLQAQPALTEDRDDPRWAAEMVAQVADGMAASSFAVRPGEHCRTCPVRTSCPVLPEGELLA